MPVRRDRHGARGSFRHAAHLHLDAGQFEVGARSLLALVYLLAHFDLAQGHGAEFRDHQDVAEDLHSGDRDLADALDQGTCDGVVAALVIRVASTDELVDVGKLLIVLIL